MDKILVIMQKEWREIRQQRTLMLTILIPPLLFTLIPIVAMSLIGQIPTSATNISTSNVSTAITALANMSQHEIAQALIGMQMSILYILLPAILTSVIASYSIVGEKTSRTLEPLLATPIKTWELLVGKSLAALLPAIIATWLGGGIFIGSVALLAVSSRVFAAIISPGWLIVFLLWTPALALIAIAMMVAVSSRVNDPRTAQQFSVILIIPFLGLFVGQITGLLVLGPTFALTVFVVLLALAALSIWIVTQLFQREIILTRWK